MKKKRIMNIAIVGLGNIGSYLYKFLSANIKQIEKKNTSKPKIIFISAKNIKKKEKLRYQNLNGLKTTWMLQNQKKLI